MMRPIVFLFVAGGALSCVSIDGGAVEASWVLGAPDGRIIGQCTCSSPEIRSVRFTLVGQAPDAVKDTRPCDGRKACEFPCQRQGGATPFDVPPGRYAIALTPVDALGQDLTLGGVGDGGGGTTQPVPPIVRDVVKGQLTQLPTLLIGTNCADSCAGMNVNRVCESQ